MDHFLISKSRADRLDRMLKWFERTGHRVKAESAAPPIIPPLGIWVRNQTGGEIPPYGCMAVADYFDDYGNDPVISDTILSVEKPSTTFHRRYVLNDLAPIPDDKVWFIPLRTEHRFRFPEGDEPESGQGYGPKPDSWELHPGYPCIMTVDGVVDSTNRIARGPLSVITSLLGKTDAAIDKDDSGTVSIWAGEPGSEVDSTMNIEDVWNAFDDVESGKWVGVNWRNGYPYLDAREC